MKSASDRTKATLATSQYSGEGASLNMSPAFKHCGYDVPLWEGVRWCWECNLLCSLRHETDGFAFRRRLEFVSDLISQSRFF